MGKYRAKVEVNFKIGVLDPQGETIRRALMNLGYKQIGSVKTGKLSWVDIEAESTAKARQTVKELADRLLANPVIEDFAVEIEK